MKDLAIYMLKSLTLGKEVNMNERVEGDSIYLSTKVAPEDKGWFPYLNIKQNHNHKATISCHRVGAAYESAHFVSGFVLFPRFYDRLQFTP